MGDGVVHGSVGGRYESVRLAFRESFLGDEEVGASFCATRNGAVVVDLWGGYADEARTRRWERDTIINVYSTTKAITALTALLVADRGELDLAAPVAKYWPAFAAAGKAEVTVAQVMSHSSGLAGWTEPITAEDLYDWDKVTGLLAAQEPQWQPGTASGYHVLTFGFLVGEVVRRVTGQPLAETFRAEIAEPLGADFHLGLPPSEDGRVADLIPPTSRAPAGREVSELQANVARNPDLPVSITRTRAWRAAGDLSAGGTGNARSVATVLAVLANGGEVAGRRLMSEAGCRRALEQQTDGRDLILGYPIRFGLGFALGDGLMPNPDTLFWGGYGGSLAIADLTARTTIGYAMNRMAGGLAGDLRGYGLAMAFWDP